MANIPSIKILGPAPSTVSPCEKCGERQICQECVDGKGPMSSRISDKYVRPIRTFAVKNMEELEVDEYSFQTREKHQFVSSSEFCSANFLLFSIAKLATFGAYDVLTVVGWFLYSNKECLGRICDSFDPWNWSRLSIWVPPSKECR